MRPPCPTDLRVHHIRSHIRVGNVLSKLAPQLGLDLLEVQGRQVGPGTTIDPRLVPNDLGPEGLGETADGLTKVSLEELDD